MQSTRPSTRQRSGVRRLGTVAGPALLGMFVLASCGADDSGATVSTIDLSASSTAFVVRPPATAAEDVATESADPEERIEGTQEYTVQSDDAPLVLVSRFDITLEALLAVNEWESTEEFPWPGTVILLPPGAKSIDAVAAGTASNESETETESEDSTGESATEETTTGTIPDAGDNCGQGTYTIAETDTSRSKVANAFDVTVEALDAANANTPGYSAFYPGLEIVIPAKSDC